MVRIRSDVYFQKTLGTCFDSKPESPVTNPRFAVGTSASYFDEFVLGEHFGDFLDVFTLVHKVELQRQVLLGLFSQPHESELGKYKRYTIDQKLEEEKKKSSWFKISKIFRI